MEFHRTQLSHQELIFEAVIISLSLLLFILRKRISSNWKMFLVNLSEKSKFAAEAAPHLIYFGTSLILSIVGKKLLLPLTSRSIMPLFTTAIPLLTTLRILSQYGNGDESRIGYEFNIVFAF